MPVTTRPPYVPMYSSRRCVMHETLQWGPRDQLLTRQGTPIMYNCVAGVDIGICPAACIESSTHM